MQCPSCAFQNMPGSGRCARCGAMLALAGQDIDVHPPRATTWTKYTAGGWRLRALGRQFWRFVNTQVRWDRFDVSEAPHVELPIVLRCIIPGWANIYTGHRSRGIILLASYLVLAFCGIWMLGTQTGAAILGFAFAIHLFSVVSALVPNFDTYRDKLIFTGICGAVLACCVYVPTGWIFSRVATPLTINSWLPPFQSGDVVWYHRTSSPRAGQYVLYNSAELDANIPAARHTMFIAEAGLRINRVIATEGQILSWDHETMLIDNQPVPWQLPATYSSVFSSVTVPPGFILIDPSNFIPGGVPGAAVTEGQVHGQAFETNIQIDARIWSQLAMVPVASVEGVVFWRSWPLARVGFVE